MGPIYIHLPAPVTNRLVQKHRHVQDPYQTSTTILSVSPVPRTLDSVTFTGIADTLTPVEEHKQR